MATVADQQKAVKHAEDLQDFRREREGQMIICEGRPLLVVSFGEKRKGSKFKAEGKYFIPVGYKCLLKLDDDEVCFMTKEQISEDGTSYPEFQIIYLPKSSAVDDFTVLDWSTDIKSIWDDLLAVFESQGRDLSAYSSGPWHVFGIIEDSVQAALQSATDNKKVDGILYCSDGVKPNRLEYEKYMSFDSAKESQYSWIIDEWVNEPLPSNFFQYVSNKMVYWVDATKQESTWKHPLFDKYYKMLKAARLQKPLPHWKSIAAFQIEQLFLNQQISEIDAIYDLARIFHIDLIAEPFLVHVLRRAVGHYVEIVTSKRAVNDVDDFKGLIDRYRSLVKEYEIAKSSEDTQSEEVRKCVECPAESKQPAQVYCDNCEDLFCEKCFTRIHSRGKRLKHKRTLVELGKCTECETSLARLQCMQCQDAFCGECFLTLHQRGGRRNHIPVCLRVFNRANHKIPATLAFGGVSSAAVTIGGTSASKLLSQALSPWVRLQDKQKLSVFHNLATRESRRDLPLAPINEPLESFRPLAWAETAIVM